MSGHTPRLQGPQRAIASLLSLEAVESLLGAALSANKADALDDLLRRRPRFTRWFARRCLQPVLGAAGDAWREPRAAAQALQVWLRWTVSQLRPDHVPALTGIDRAAWLERTSWRPMLAVMCHYGFAAVPEFRERYRPRPDESAADNLCGLWAVGPSTFYRYLDKGKRLLAEWVHDRPLGAEQRLSLRALADEAARPAGANDAQRAAWHRRQSVQAVQGGDIASALWHALRGGDADAFLQLLQRHRIELADDAETDALVDALAATALTDRQRFDLCLAEAALHRARNAHERERESCEKAQRLASALDDKLMLGIVAGALGKYHEPRDDARAFAYYQDSVDFLREAGLEDGGGDVAPEVAQEYVHTLVKLAWLYVLRNDPRSKAALDEAQARRHVLALPAQLQAMLDQAWGEYWRRAGDLRRAIEHKHRALNAYERLGDRQAVLKTYGNLSLIHGDAKDFGKAIEYSRRVLAMAEQFPVEPETVAATWLNLGGTYFWQGKYEQAIEAYRQALEKSTAARLAVLVGRSHYNLAEAYYKRFQAGDDPLDEKRGDAHAAAALAAWPQGDPAPAEATRQLKSEILGARDERFYDRLLPQELAAHPAEMEAVLRQRAVLALPGPAQDQVRAHLAIAREYLAVSSKEREAALALVHKHGLKEQFAAEFEQLRSTFNRGLTREQQLASRWADEAGELLQEARRIAVLEHLFRAGSIQKSIYAQVCGVGLATASKHLVTLAERGLLEQTGKGPSTRYVLPA